MPPRTSQPHTGESVAPAHRLPTAPVASLTGTAQLQRQIGNRAAASLIQRQSARTATNLIQREGDDDEGYDDDDRGALLSEEKKVEEHYRELGLDLIEAYRLMDQFSDAIAAKKNTSAAKGLTASLISLSIAIAGKFAALPDIPFGPDFAMPDASDLLKAPEAMDIAGAAAGQLEDMTEEADTSGSGVRHGTTTFKGQAKAAIKKRFGSKGAVARTVVGLVIPIGTLQTALKSVKQLAESKDDWNRSKGVLAQSIEHTVSTMDQVCERIESAGMQEIAVTATKRKLSFRTSVRTLAEVVKKYESKRDKLQAVIAKWEVKHMDARPLLSGDSSSDDD